MKRVLLLLALGTMLSVSIQAAVLNGQQKSTAAQTASKKAASPEPAKTDDKKAEDCGCEVKAPPDVLATVDGTNVSVKEIDEPIKDRIQALQDQVIEARKRELDLQINSQLLEAEAKRLGTTSDKLLEREIVSKVKQPADAEAQAFYEQNKSRIEGSFADVKDQIIGYLRAQREKEEAGKYADRLRARAQVKVLSQEVTPPQSEADRARVFATVNGKRVTSAEIEDALKPLIFAVQEQVYNLRKQRLDLKINDILLEREAQKRNMTGTQLFDAEVLPRVKPVTEDSARKYYEENRNRMPAGYAQLRGQIIQYLQNRERNNAESAYADQLRKSTAVQVFLKMPDPPVFDIAIEGRPWKGGANAAVTIVEFTDYECPSCGSTQPVLEEVVKEFGDKVKLVARNFPLDQHKHAFKAAEAAEAAREQGKYWEYTALLFRNQKALEVDDLKNYATELGLDRRKFDAALDSGRLAEKVKQDLADGNKIGVDSTPSVFINGKRLRERKPEDFRAAIEAALKDAGKK